VVSFLWLLGADIVVEKSVAGKSERDLFAGLISTLGVAMV
jgi:hypothetical protein